MIYVIGFLAQAFFSARILCQWILSEKAKKVVSPTIYWVLSLVGSFLLFLYGWMRDDFAIVFGQMLSYYIYIWNLKNKGVWQQWLRISRIALILIPFIVVFEVLNGWDSFVQDFFKNEQVPIWLLIYGSLGQVIFTLRFIYQWIYSMKKQESMLPLGFWVISLIGSSIIISYALYRLDPVLILGQSVGFIAYIRNITLHRQSLKEIPQET